MRETRQPCGIGREANPCSQQSGRSFITHVAAVLGVGIVVVVIIRAGIVGVFLYPLSRIPNPPQPVFGFTGNWRSTCVFGFEERPLPPAADVWQDYLTWRPKAKNQQRLYVARLGGAARQSAFLASTNSGDTPMGAQKYTHVDFIYTDPTNGMYRLSWALRGEHDPSFLRFDDSYRLYQLELGGQTTEYPPALFVQGVEGVKPEY